MFGRVAEDELGSFFMDSVKENIENDKISLRKSSAIIEFSEQTDISNASNDRRCEEQICRIQTNKKRLINRTDWCRNNDKKLTGFVCLTPSDYSLKYYYYNWCHKNNINDYNVKNLEKALRLTELNGKDFVFVSSFLFVHKEFDIDECKEYFRVIGQTGAQLILDLVDKDIPKKLSLNDLIDCVSLCNPSVIVGEYLTLKDFVYTKKVEQLEHPHTIPVWDDQALFLKKFSPFRFIIWRYGDQNCTSQETFGLEPYRPKQIFDTGHGRQPFEMRRGFADGLTAQEIRQLIKEGFL